MARPSSPAESTSESESHAEPTTEDLKAQIGKLSEDIASLTEIVGGLSEKSARQVRDEIRARGNAAAERGQREFEQVQRAAQQMQGDVDDMIAQRPMMSVGLALGLGFLFGIMTGRK